MNQTRSRLTVYFEDPFWVGIYEREADGQYEVCRLIFGAEPKDCEIYEFLLGNWRKLRFSSTISSDDFEERGTNPKRLQREAQKAVQSRPVGTKAQQALKLQQEQGKLARKVKSKAQREAEEERQFQLRQEKRREKHRGH